VDTPVILITGALTGIGRASAVAFAKKGAKVVVAGRHDDAGKVLAEQLRSIGSEAEFINADVRNEDDVRALVDQTVARFGRLDVAVNNAGTEGRPSPITDQTADTYTATFDTNVLGVILSMKHQVRVMQEQGSGSIINISSTYGHEGAAGASVYVGSKHAVEGITKSVALEVAKSGIRVNAVAPGPTDTKIPGPDHPITIEKTGLRVLARVGTHLVADTTRALTLREAGYPPVQYIPLDDVDQTLLAASETRTYCPYKGDASYYTITLLEGELTDAVWSYREPYEAVAPIANYVAFYTDRVEVVTEPA
jgi:NAD(P)-dependent dehydrogenase (short-subunit alcohol dehydrogenase family)